MSAFKFSLDQGGRATPLSTYKFVVQSELNRLATKPELRIIVRCRRKDFSFQQTLDAINDAREEI